MDDQSVMSQINRLVDEEHHLLDESRQGPLEPARRERLEEVQTALDRCWDLLRQRRAHREFHEDPDAARPRSAEIVEKYLQ
jgi:hypothetical protein